MSRHYEFAHLRISAPAPKGYKAAPSPVQEMIPARQRQQQVEQLKNQLFNAQEQIIALKQLRKQDGYDQLEGFTITVKGMPEYQLKSEGLQNKKQQIDVLNTGVTANGEEYAIVRLPKGDIRPILEKVDSYGSQDTLTGKPKYQRLIDSIETLSKSILLEFWTETEEDVPPLNDTPIWWEVWLLGGKDDDNLAERMRNQFAFFAQKENVEFDPMVRIDFPERQVILVKMSSNSMSKAVQLLDCITQLGPPSRGLRDWYALESSIERQINEHSKRLLPPTDNAATITVIDTGIADAHPLLKPAIRENGLHSIDPQNTNTGDYHGHGTEMAGVALYHDLSGILMSSDEYRLPAYLESVRVPLDTDGSRQELWGMVTENAIKKVESVALDRNRVFCMAIGSATNTSGGPTSWSSAVDQLCYNNGEGRIIAVAAGNVSPIDLPNYPARNLSTQLDDPAQARNAITVGAMTQFPTLAGDYPTMRVIANSGGLSPHSATHGTRNDAIKPEIVCEGGNVAWNGTDADSGLEGLSILTTNRGFIMGRPLTFTCATSPATANASRMLAQIWEANPDLRPETVRGILIHSASWTPEMKRQFPDKRDLLRSCGYGTPDVHFACKSATSAVTLISEATIRTNYRERIHGLHGPKWSSGWKRDILIFDLPWPEERLLELGETEIELIVTLSYFAEPSPKNKLQKYEGAGLRWELQNSAENTDAFSKRVNAAERAEGETGFGGSRDWQIGKSFRSRGTVQSDRWIGTAAELATRRKLAVYPTVGWWNDNKSKYSNPEIPFSLIVSIRSTDVEIDLYNWVSTQISNRVDVDV